MQRSSPLRWRRTIRNSTQNSLSTVRGGSMSSPTSKHRARQNLRLHSSLQLESLGQGTGARRECSMAFVEQHRFGCQCTLRFGGATPRRVAASSERRGDQSKTSLFVISVFTEPDLMPVEALVVPYSMNCARAARPRTSAALRTASSWPSFASNSTSIVAFIFIVETLVSLGEASWDRRR